MIDAFLSRYGLKGLKVGGPLLSLLEAAAQSDVRGTQDVFNLLDAIDIDRATGIALDRRAKDEDITRFPISASSGVVTVFDTSFTKVATKIYPGAAAPNAGTTVIKVADATSFPATGSLYLGRDTVNFEGPITYASKASLGTYWTITLNTATQKFHDVNETVTLAQGGERSVSAGSVIRTTQGNVADAVSFATINAVTIPDGETEVTGVDVICKSPGVIGNVIKGAIVEFASPPFVGASVTNPLPIDNGLPAEDDTSLRERIKAARQSRSRGTPLALITNAKGIKAGDENKTVISASVFSPQGEPTVLFIDDGTGYEETNSGIALETLMDLAVGGEQYFKLTGEGGSLPITKAFVQTKLTAPFALQAGAVLSVNVAGVITTHSFSESEFRAIGNATAFEVVAAINGDPNLAFSARTAENGTGVVLFARSELNEDLEVVEPDDSIDANTYLGFPSGTAYTLRLYKNDQLLYKDGRSAIILSTTQSAWSPTIGDGIYVKIKTDGTKAQVFKISNADFSDNSTGYSTVNSLNSLEAWATVFNAKLPGVNCTVASGALQFTSNRGPSSLARLEFMEPSANDKDTDGVTVTDANFNLVAAGMFTAEQGLVSAGRSNDYTLNRNTGELKLTSALAANDSLAAGTIYTRAYIQSTIHSTSEITFATAPTLWFIVDGAASAVTTGLTSSTALDITAPAGSRRRYTTNPATAVFQNVQNGDWMILWDPAFAIKGAWRVCAVDAGFTYVEIERPDAHVDVSGTPTSNGLLFVRSKAPIQSVTLTSGANRSLITIAAEINAAINGVTASVYRNKYLRVTTDTYASNGDIFLAAADIQGQLVALPRGTLASNSASHVPAIESDNSESGTPTFELGAVSATASSGTILTVSGITLTGGAHGLMTHFLRRAPTGSPVIGWGNHVDEWTPILSISGSDVTVRYGKAAAMANDRIVATSPYSIGPEDNLTAILDDESASKNYSLPMWRKIKPVAGQSYGATGLQVLDADNSNVPLSTAFGTSMSFRDFALFMHARAKSHSTSGGSAPAGYHDNKALLWRYTRMGAEGNQARVAYVNPTAAAQAISLTTLNGQYADILVSLPSGAARTGLSLYDTTRFTVGVSVASPADTVTYTYSKPTVSLTRTGGNTVTGTTGVAHGFAIGDVVYITSADVNFASGPKTVVTTPLSTTFTYIETGANVTAAGQTCSSAPADPNFGSVVVGDIVNISSSTAFASPNRGAYRVTAKTSTTFTVKRLTGVVSADTTPRSIVGAANLSFFPINTASSTASAIATWINANASAVVTAVAVENGGGAPGTGAIDRATVDEYIEDYYNVSGSAVQAYQLADGVNWIQSSVLGSVPNTITMKASVTSSLVTDSDFDNEEMRLVPITVDGISAFLSNAAVSGFYAGSTLINSSRGAKLQINSNTSGSQGSIQITGGSANNASANITGAGAVVDTNYSKVTTLTSGAKGLIGKQFVAVQGSNTQVKTVPITAASVLSSIAASSGNWLLTFDVGTTLWNRKQQITDTSDRWQIDRVGDFVCYKLIDAGGATTIDASVTEGDWVTISLQNASPVNAGTFRVVRKTSTTVFWVENPQGISEAVEVDAGDDISFYSYDSVMPGDQLIIDTNTFGTANRGTFTVISGATLAYTVKVSGSMTAYTNGGAVVLGTDAGFIRFMEAAPIRLIKRIHTIGRTPGTTDYTDVVFDTPDLATKMSLGAGASIQPLDKLDFDTDAVTGSDAYSYSTGLIGEVNKVIYGDRSNPSVYPGVVAAGAQVNISGPLVKRIQVGLAVRLRKGATERDVLDRVKSAVASVINRVGLGQSVDLSSIVSAARAIDGVAAVTILSPTYSSGNDLIPVQANEKPRVLDIDQDILVSVVGQ